MSIVVNDLPGQRRGQAITEFALVFPMFVLALVGSIVVGMFLFYQAQVTNAAREGARFAVVHSATAQCPTVSWKDPNLAALSLGTYARCDPPPSWPKLTDFARAKLWGLPKNLVGVTACWSGYTSGTSYDQPPTNPATSLPNTYSPCTIGGLSPSTGVGSLPCPATTGPGDDMASDLHDNHVTVYACYTWTPPFAGLFFLPNSVTIRAVVTEVIQRQQ
jgi:TadE-like protein